MSRMWIVAVAVLAGAANVGCSTNGSWASGITRSEIFNGQLGITGHENNYTIETGSSLDRLSIIGNNNRITVQWGVKLGKVEIWGQNNTVALPNYLIVRKSIVGNNNQFIETPREQFLPPREVRYYPTGEPAPTYQQVYPPPASPAPASGGVRDMQPMNQ